MPIPSTFITTQTDAQRADLRNMFASKGKGYEQELYHRDRHSYHVFRVLYWQLIFYDEKYGVPAEPRSTSPMSSLVHSRPMDAIREGSVEAEVPDGAGWSDDSILVASPTFSEMIGEFPDVPGGG
ncbi:hypothetical protein CLAFUW4_12166 [Fulvia fulva]|uniref:Uncharacterized protein n=1 Tax=Passalora fulva TaxID=5499 RepID=A0A9Q8PDY4_PASFU|nr:uncharacterized protein CLAFUR5_11203 [Fulvia fulva]KAK4618971.1 hypothetical protein CLAFUR0_12182 [Fulvia fulva]UJO20804.1 hypothetical protein CLAFUR5_11203 [Fulvia fulva]WPV18303.1 hypothetical protein CLAFUW4_12166 [Fulvia fulva]WPV32922.1 hypothetical protein CLAFUW7_12173 [Fulvia fulva]